MYDPYISEPGVEYNSKEIGENDFFDMDYDCEELPEDFILEALSEVLRQDRDVVIPKQRIVKDGFMFSSVGSVDTFSDPPVFTFGPRNVEQPNIKIIPDYTGVLVSMKYYDKVMQGENPMYPYVPVAQPSVPAAAVEPAPQFGDLDSFMFNNGALIYGPHYDFEDKHDVTTFIDYKKPLEDRIEYCDNMIKKYQYKFVFSPKEDLPVIIKQSHRYAQMEFNPFHPMAPPYIESYSDNGVEITGTYKWGRRIRKFYFDRMDVRYRIHSEVWYCLFGYCHYYMSMFDIVSNFDIVSLIPRLNITLSSRKYTLSPIRIAEGYELKKESDVIREDRIYSYMPEERSFQEDTRHALVVPYYSNIPIRKERVGERYADVSRDYQMQFNIYDKYELQVARKDTGLVVLRIMKGEKTSKFQGISVFVFFSLRLKVVKCYQLYDEKKHEGYDSRCFFLVKGAQFLGAPRNYLGSLLRDFGEVSFDDFVKMVKTRRDNSDYIRSMAHFSDKYKEEQVASTGEVYPIQVQDQEVMDEIEEAHQDLDEDVRTFSDDICYDMEFTATGISKVVREDQRQEEDEDRDW